jgi:hypothetical protein
LNVANRTTGGGPARPAPVAATLGETPTTMPQLAANSAATIPRIGRARMTGLLLGSAPER